MTGQRITTWLIGAIGLLSALNVSWPGTQTLEISNAAGGLRLLVARENSLPSLRILVPGQPASARRIEVLFPEHVTVREHGKGQAEHLYLWRPGQVGKRPDWRQVGQSLEYEMNLKNVHMLARATLEPDGVLFHYSFKNRSTIDYGMLEAVIDPRLYTSLFRDVRLERTYVHRSGHFELLAQETRGRLTMPLDQWLPRRYLDSYTWPVPSAAKRVVRDQGIIYYNASRPVDVPMTATVSQDGKWVAATCSLDAGNVWTNPELTCQHADPEVHLKPKGSASWETKTFIFRGSLAQAFEKVKQQRLRWKNEPAATR
jgi:hypothetical protein